MTNTSIILGEATLDSYLSPPKQLDNNKKEEIRGLIEKLEKRSMNVEQLPLRMLRLELAQYPGIDPTFLTMSLPLTMKKDELKEEIQVPRFSVYKRTSQGFASFVVVIHPQSGFPEYTLSTSVGSRDFSELISDPLMESLKLSEKAKSIAQAEWQDSNQCLYHLPRKLWKGYNRLGNVRIGTEFHGIIPDKTKTRLDEAERVFPNDQIY
ncbi:hypothetical protein KY317_00030, partial [Candidatus Woesearchaeota archaeon]|nr:hypothetical protein [Candidatus Woesearchaeota archaeon]